MPYVHNKTDPSKALMVLNVVIYRLLMVLLFLRFQRKRMVIAIVLLWMLCPLIQHHQPVHVAVFLMQKA